MTNYPQELAQDAVCQSHTGSHWALVPAKPGLQGWILMNELGVNSRRQLRKMGERVVWTSPLIHIGPLPFPLIFYLLLSKKQPKNIIGRKNIGVRAIYPYSTMFSVCVSRIYMGHCINNAQVGKTAEWMMQFQWKLWHLQKKTWGSSTCVRYFPSKRRFELTSVRHVVCRRLGYCDGWRSKIAHQDWNFTWQKPYRNSQCFAWSLWWADSGPYVTCSLNGPWV